jgi:hypothetical protein
MDNEKFYYISQYDNRVHNINDVEYQLIANEDNTIHQAYIGKDCGDDGFRVDEEVTLYTILEVAEFYK